MSFRNILVLLVPVLVLPACVAHDLQAVTEEISDQSSLSFLVDGQTDLKEVVSKLGRPAAEFSGGQLWTYRLDDKYRTVMPRNYSPTKWASSRHRVGLPDWKGVKYSLVLFFDDADGLQHHRLIRIR